MGRADTAVLPPAGKGQKRGNRDSGGSSCQKRRTDGRDRECFFEASAQTQNDVAGPNAVVELRDLAFSNPSGQGLSVDQGANVVMLDCTIRDNHSGFAGAGLLITSGSLLVRASEFRNNSATAGPAVWASTSGSVVTIENSIIQDNTATAGSGGAIESIGSTIEITNTILTGNTSALDGGAISASENLTLGPDVVIDGNEALAGDGAGVYLAGGSHSIANSTISSNIAASGRRSLRWVVGSFSVDLQYDRA